MATSIKLDFSIDYTSDISIYFRVSNLNITESNPQQVAREALPLYKLSNNREQLYNNC